MPVDFTYISLLSILIVLPTLIIIALNVKTLMRYKIVILLSLVILLSTWLWDYFSIVDRVWYFKKILGVWFLGLPIEEIIFMTFLILLVSSVTIKLLKR